MNLLQTILNISNSERQPVLLSFAYFFCLMSGYFILRPVRDEMGIQAGIENMQWLFTGTFIVMLLVVPVFGYLTQRFPKRKLIPGIYIFFIFNIFLFYWGFSLSNSTLISVVFFIWLSVFNLFVVSIFWSFNADIFSENQAKRLFPPIAAGGSMGAIFGPSVTSLLVNQIGVENLLLISAFFLGVATYFLLRLLKLSKSDNERKLIPIKDGIWKGLTLIIRSPYLTQIGLFIFLYTSVSTFLYFEQAHIISNAYESSIDRTSYFGLRDLLVNSVTLFLQFFVTERLLRKVGVIFCLALVPAVSILGFFSLGINQSVLILLIIQMVYRSLNFSVQRPTREVLYTKVSIEEKYNSKNFIDTVLYRGGDAASGWIFTGLSSFIGSMQAISFVAIPIAIGWFISGIKIGRLFNENDSSNQKIESYVITKKSA